MLITLTSAGDLLRGSLGEVFGEPLGEVLEILGEVFGEPLGEVFGEIPGKGGSGRDLLANRSERVSEILETERWVVAAFIFAEGCSYDSCCWSLEFCSYRANVRVSGRFQDPRVGDAPLL